MANHTNTEVEVRSDTHFFKMATTNLSLLTIASNTSELFQKTPRNPRKVAKQMSFSPLPAWELMKADYDINYTDTKKKKKKKRENPHILSYLVKSHIADN